MPWPAAPRFCGSTSSGSSATPRSTSSILPVFGIASEIIPVFSRKVIFGYPVMVAATLAIGFIGASVWVHHMFTVGLGAPVNSLFAATTMAIAVPTGIKIFNWLGTLWGGRLRFATPMLFCTAFLFQFLAGGLTGVMLAVVPFDWQVSDSYFVVAHFHYVLIGGLVFLFFAGIYYWFPKATGRMLDESLGRWHFWLFVVGFNVTMGILHFAGLLGMPRRIYTYQTGHGWDTINLIASLGVIPQVVGVLLFVINIVVRCGGARPPGTIPGTPGPWSGPRRRLRPSTTSRSSPWCAAGGPSGISSTPRTRTGGTSDLGSRPRPRTGGCPPGAGRG